MTAFANRLAKEKKENYVEGWVIHQYPKWNAKVPDLLATTKSDWDDVADKIKKNISKSPGACSEAGMDNGI